MKKRGTKPASGCPGTCPKGGIQTQREITSDEFALLSPTARGAVFGSVGRCFVCSACGLAYIKGAFGVQPLGQITFGSGEFRSVA